MKSEFGIVLPSSFAIQTSFSSQIPLASVSCRRIASTPSFFKSSVSLFGVFHMLGASTITIILFNVLDTDLRASYTASKGVSNSSATSSGFQSIVSISNILSTDTLVLPQRVSHHTCEELFQATYNHAEEPSQS